ncbi:double-strand break repair helicase AddA [Croceicoccus sp. Ery5]|uniref:double-strand break repair helicase AddA n=1 Tax=Croceicoccus sp. Ery5 TaxID=1703340 RepID=UPI001E4F7844|nr:double-strand break repair helicase AddA [Croceicoccus sp. Ery5]
MSGPAKVYPLAGSQREAVNPADTVWLSASAGTGKTQVLSARVLRLLLQPDVEPSQILCLTFTKAGAAEMANRVNDVLASWVRADQIDLAADLKAIGADFGPEDIARARTRFAAVLDCPGGGLRIETIHAFSQWLLSAFPLEAGLVPGTRPMEDRDRELLLRDTLAELLIQAEERGDTSLTDALATLSLRADQGAIERFLMACAEARAAWEGTGSWVPPLLPRVYRLLGLKPDHCEAHVAALCGPDAFDCRALEAAESMLRDKGGKKALDAAEPIAAWLASDADKRLETLDHLYNALFTQKGEPRKLVKDSFAYDDAVEAVRASIDRVIACRDLGALAQWLAPALTLGRAFALKWGEAKARAGLIDFDDQIAEAARLLKRSDMADWIRYKLDRQFDHILVDEAQDTNSAQWDVIDALTEEFFTGEGARGDRLRTLFVVGDYKQAIFRFQGTSPENFKLARDRVKERMAVAIENLSFTRGAKEHRPFREYGLARSYRTAQPVLDFVDAAIAEIGPEALGLADDPGVHLGEKRPGQVVMWRTVGDPVGLDDEADEGEEGWLSRPDRRVAENIATQIRHWIDAGFPLVKGGERLAGPGDVMVLVRKRKELAGLIVARLHAKGVAVAGVDRLRLGAPLGVRDLMAAMRFAAQPEDDLSLACLLVSPIFGWTQEELLEHGWREKGVRLYDRLRQSTEARPRQALAMLNDLLRLADYDTPQALLHWMLVGPWQARRRLAARLGGEVNDPIDEMLNAAMAFSASQTPSLTGFIRWFEAGDGELKREADQQGGLVRVMTVHGSKGLQAPIVILADAADDPDLAMPRTLELAEPLPDMAGFAPRTIPLPSLKKSEKLGPIAAAEEEAAREEREEHWRLLYVAMTRAEEALFIAGALRAKKTEPPANSWYARLAPLFGDSDDWLADPVWGGAKRLGQGAQRTPGMPAGAKQSGFALLPGWALAPAGAEPAPPRPLAPSSLGDPHEAAEPPLAPMGGIGVDAARRGVLIHRLLERLPELAGDRRADAATRWLARQAADLSDETRAEMVQAAVRTLNDPACAALFAPEALAEVSLSATVGTRVVAGTVDRLHLGNTPADPIRIVDFKTARRPPERLDQVPPAYLRQMAAYACALEAIHPARTVEALLLYTHAPRIFAIPPEILEREKAALRGG